jgi:RNA polymerase sigma-70 factor (ECF subfamily)
MASGALRDQASRLREELTAMIPSLEIIVGRALGAGDDARDAAQEILARALKAIDEGRYIRESLGAFVHGIAVHVIADVRAARDRMPVADVSPDAVATESGDGPLDRLIGEQERITVEAALARLDPRDRELLRRCFVLGQKISDIAAAMGEPAARIRKQKSRALQQLRALLGPDGRDGHTLFPGQTRKA